MQGKLRLVNHAFHAMGSPCHIQFYALSRLQAQEAKQSVKQCLEKLEQRYSRYRKDSFISVINNGSGLGAASKIDAEMAALLAYADQCFQESEGLFDVTSGILRKLWSLDKTEIPSEEQINECRQLIGWNKVEWTQNSVYLPQQGMQLDFGGIVKEYAADSVAQLLKSKGITSGIIELGGDIKVIGPRPSGQGWPVAIRNPLEKDQQSLQLTITHGAVASSGDYERFQEIDGVRYSHILNPKTGMPTTGLRAVSILSEHCVVAGSIATLAMLKGSKGFNWLQENELDFFCCLDSGEIHQQISGY